MRFKIKIQIDDDSLLRTQQTNSSIEMNGATKHIIILYTAHALILIKYNKKKYSIRQTFNNIEAVLLGIYV